MTIITGKSVIITNTMDINILNKYAFVFSLWDYNPNVRDIHQLKWFAIRISNCLV